jgi:hypothetical protein
MGPYDPRLILIADAAKVRPPHVFHLWHALAQPNFDPEAFAIFARLELKHITAIISALSDRDMMPTKPARASQGGRGTRLSHDWTLPPDWLAWAREKRFWTEADTMAESESFADYWHGRAGSGGVKLDWRATWQNWVRNSKRPNGTHSPTATIRSDADRIEHLERTVSLYERMGRHNEIPPIRRQIAELRNANVVDASARFAANN